MLTRRKAGFLTPATEPRRLKPRLLNILWLLEELVVVEGIMAVAVAVLAAIGQAQVCLLPQEPHTQ